MNDVQYYFVRGGTFRQEFQYADLKTQQALNLPIGATYEAKVMNIRSQQTILLSVTATNASTLLVTAPAGTSDWELGSSLLEVKVQDGDGNIWYSQQTEFYVKRSL